MLRLPPLRISPHSFIGSRAVGESLGPSLESSPSHLGLVTRVESRVTSLMCRVTSSHKPYVSSHVESDSDDFSFKKFNVVGYNHALNCYGS